MQGEIATKEIKEGESIGQHLERLVDVSRQLEAAGQSFSDAQYAFMFLRSLPPSYDPLVMTLQGRETTLTLDFVSQLVLQEEARRKREGTQPDHALIANFKRLMQENRSEVKRREGKKDNDRREFSKVEPRRCFYCNEVGHLIRNCQKKRADQSKDGAQAHVTEEKDEKESNVAFVAIAAASEDHSQARERPRVPTNQPCCDTQGCSMPTEMASLASGEDHSEIEWLVDSAATSHMTREGEHLDRYQAFSNPKSILVGDNQMIEAVGMGRVKIELCDGREVVVEEVLHVPRIVKNLLSVPALTKLGYEVVFKEAGCEIKRGEVVMVRGKQEDRLFRFRGIVRARERALLAVATTTKDALWHRRLGHLSAAKMKTMAEKQLVHDFTPRTRMDTYLCEVCVQAKQHREPFYEGQRSKAKTVLELVYADLCGPFEVQSLGGSKYLLLFVDDFSRFMHAYFLRGKDESVKKFIDHVNLSECQTGKKVRRLRTDNGGEFKGGAFGQECLKRGILQEFTAPYTPQQNGAVERRNRIVVEMARALLGDANLPKRLWAEAIGTAVHILNRVPTKAIGNSTPYFMWFGHRPSVGHLRVYGSVAYALKVGAHMHKLDPRCRKGVLVGYNADGHSYKLYDGSCSKVFIARDVIFDESSTRSKHEEQGGHTQLQKADMLFLEDVIEEKEAPTVRGGEEVTHEAEAEEEDHPTEIEPAPERRQPRARRTPIKFQDYVLFAESERMHLEPQDIQDARESKDWTKWEEAMQEELKAMRRNQVWDLVKLPIGRKSIGCKWVFKIKCNENAEVVKYKARLVAKGYSQVPGIDYHDTFAPVARLESIRLLIALGVMHGYEIHQLDVVTAFLNGKLEEEVYMRQPPGFEEGDHVCKLKRAIYGLKQASRAWYTTIDGNLQTHGFQRCSSDPSLYVLRSSDAFAAVALYVDDIVLVGNERHIIARAKGSLQSCFEVKDMGEVNYILGIHVKRDKQLGLCHLSQRRYVCMLLDRFGMTDCHPVKMPINTGEKISGDMCPKEEKDKLDLERFPYRSLIGSLMYAAVCTRPDISYVVMKLSQYLNDPGMGHWIAAKRVLRYLKGTMDYGPTYSKESKKLIGFADADWGGDLDERKSTSGYVFMMGGAPISWASRKQESVSLSTTEAEYISVCEAAKEYLWYTNMIQELGTYVQVELLNDNSGCLQLSQNGGFHKRSKHIALRYQFLKDLVRNKQVTLRYCNTSVMLADILTKGLSADRTRDLCERMGLLPHPLE